MTGRQGPPTEDPDDAPNFLVPKIPGTAILAAVGLLLFVLAVIAAGVRLSRGEALFTPIDTDAALEDSP